MIDIVMGLLFFICGMGLIIANLYDHIIRLDKQVKLLTKRVEVAENVIAQDDLK